MPKSNNTRGTAIELETTKGFLLRFRMTSQKLLTVYLIVNQLNVPQGSFLGATFFIILGLIFIVSDIDFTSHVDDATFYVRGQNFL